MLVSADDVLDFWFGKLAPDGSADPEVAARWWQKSVEFDGEIQWRFGDTVEAAARGELDGWQKTANGTAALIIVLDQFTRNIHRGTAQAYANDERALKISLDLLEDSERWAELGDMARYFALMPTMHSEDLAVQKIGLRAFRRAEDEARSTATEESLAQCVHFHERHMAIIERFGRYPQRNNALGRETTDEEREFMAQPGSSF